MSLFTLLITLFFIFSTYAESNHCGKQCQYTIEGTTLKITGSGKMQDFYGDKAIPWKDTRETITEIQITGVTSIGKRAFQNMIKLTSITFDSVISIGEGAFYNTGLTQITIPASVEKIERNAFEENTQLTKILFTEESKLTTIDERAFKNCEKLESIDFPDSVVTMGKKLFEGCLGLKSVSIGSKLENLGDSLFIKCYSLSQITINENNKHMQQLIM